MPTWGCVLMVLTAAGAGALVGGVAVAYWISRGMRRSF